MARLFKLAVARGGFWGLAACPLDWRLLQPGSGLNLTRILFFFWAGVNWLTHLSWGAYG